MFLGLYSLSKRIEALGGEYGVCDRSDGNQGSMFWFTFPYRPDEAAAKADMSDGTPGIAYLSRNTSDLVPPRKILVIDDSPSVLKVTSRLLTMNGHTVVTASNGAVGLQMLKESYINQLYDMVLTDLQMPVMDGIEATKRFRLFENEKENENRQIDDDSSTNSNDNLNNNLNNNSNSNFNYSSNDFSSNSDNNSIPNFTNNNFNNSNFTGTGVSTGVSTGLSTGVNGVVQNMQKNKKNVVPKRMLIVGMSANSDNRSKQEALESGMDYFVAKPFSYKELMNILITCNV